MVTCLSHAETQAAVLTVLRRSAPDNTVSWNVKCDIQHTEHMGRLASSLTHPNIWGAQQFASVRLDFCSFGGVEKQQRRPQQQQKVIHHYGKTMAHLCSQVLFRLYLYGHICVDMIWWVSACVCVSLRLDDKEILV